jgi:hypothetical protein
MNYTEYKVAYGTDIKSIKNRQLIDRFLVATMNKDEKTMQELIKSLLPTPKAPEKAQEAVKATTAPEKVVKTAPATAKQAPAQKPVARKEPFAHLNKPKAGKPTGKPFAHLQKGDK